MILSGNHYYYYILLIIMCASRLLGGGGAFGNPFSAREISRYAKCVLDECTVCIKYKV